MTTPLRRPTLLGPLFALALTATLALHAQDAAPLQSWIASDGRVIQAKFVKLDGESVVIEKDGARFAVPFAKLSPASVALARKLPPLPESSPGESSTQPPPSAPVGFALIPAGTFTMGDSLDGDGDATPHQVNVSAFYMQIDEINKAQWDAVRSWGLKHGYPDIATNLAKDVGTATAKAPDHPVQSVSWYDIVKWCNAHSEKDGLTPCYTLDGSVYRMGSKPPDCNWSATGYRLPSEAEWEKAARGGLSGKRFPWGDTITQRQANYGSDKSVSYDLNPTRGAHPTYKSGNPPFTSPVGKFPSNGYGLHDMAGNVGEWCWDWYGPYPASEETDPRGAATGSCRVGRGGGWNNGAKSCRVAARGFGIPTNSGTVGFRTARSLGP